jgi:hypothetical protein
MIQASENVKNRFGKSATHIELEQNFSVYLWINIWYKVSIVNDLSEIFAA